MKRWKSLTAALCAAVLLCGFSTTAYAGGGEYEDYGDPTMETPAPEPEPTIEPGQGFSEEGGFVTRDLLYDENTNKQFITVQTSGGAVPVDGRMAYCSEVCARIALRRQKREYMRKKRR